VTGSEFGPAQAKPSTVRCSCQPSGRVSASDQIVAHNPPSVWTVPETFKPVYSHAAEARGIERLLMISGQFGVAPNGDLAADFGTQCERDMDKSRLSWPRPG
jgi:hypothetical protein